MLTKEVRLELLEHLAQRIRNVREDRIREWLTQTFPRDGVNADDLEKGKATLYFLERLSDRDLIALGRTLRLEFDPVATERHSTPIVLEGN